MTVFPAKFTKQLQYEFKSSASHDQSTRHAIVLRDACLLKFERFRILIKMFI